MVYHFVFSSHSNINMLNTMANKLELSDTVVTKAMEYRRLTDVKCSVLLKRYSDNCICVVCLQLASKSLGAEFDEVCVCACVCSVCLCVCLCV